ncbi:PREDICTED: zinc finger protein 518A-like isoform X1 [Cyprinodon variegatus]|uniref:zinc finger protein 518A-like isoform X1 n=2 Tax=Cyprinodon variegatus TaxID=28743 RepID=UPI000742A5D3|nr:PREDICTED: zinc finger protein 518A-like isoform X1 [Cyprinodon variegatus]
MKLSWPPLAELSSSPQKKKKETRRNMDICTATSTGHAKRRVNKKNRSWQRRLHLRKTVVQPPAMQSQDKNGPKKIVKKWERTSVWPPSKEAPQEARLTNDGGSTLRFPCSQCEDKSEYAPKDLVRHFVEKHRGSLPVFPCQMCTFSAHEFSLLQVHLLSHKDTFSSCSMCNDNVQRTWPEYSAHLTMYHCSEGKYSCETCKTFSTCDFRGFLEHIYKHNFNVEEVVVDSSLQRNDKSRLPASQTQCCQFCSFEASEKWLINKHIKTSHVCQNANQTKDARQVCSVAMKPNDPIPRVKTRLTRSAVRNTCWLTQDYISFPGKEFLDKYCHLSDPQTTLEETQQFLMQSVAGETDDQKWTKALKSVLSSVPQKNSENGITPNTSDLAVLTVKNKITVAQNGAAYPKRLKMTSTDKEAVCTDSADGSSLCASSQNGFDLNVKNQAEIKPCNDFSSCDTGKQENRENHEVKTHLEIQENGQELEKPAEIEGIFTSSDLKLANESEEKTSVGRASTKRKTQKRRCRRKARFRKVQRKSQGEALKIVIKKNQVKGRQWVSQSSLSPKEEVELGHNLELPNPHLVEKVQPMHHPDQNCIDGSLAASPHVSKKSENCESFQRKGAEDVTENKCDPLVYVPSIHEETEENVEKSGDFTDQNGSGEETRRLKRVAPSLTEEGTPKDLQLQKSLQKDDPKVTEKRSPNAVLLHGTLHSVHSCHEAEQQDQTDEGLRNVAASADLIGVIRSCQSKTSVDESSPAERRHWRQVPKHQPRTLKLVAINPSQAVKRPAGDQPVVVLNHPDADIPQVARIMEVVNKYREVRKVLLSRRTLMALSAASGEASDTDVLIEDQGENSVQERFPLRLKFRRLSRKKYEVVGLASPGREASAKFSCWFCGRVFTSQEQMMVHRQRHLMEWKKPNCEKS